MSRMKDLSTNLIKESDLSQLGAAGMASETNETLSNLRRTNDGKMRRS
jgi:hypothetical protein